MVSRFSLKGGLRFDGRRLTPFEELFFEGDRLVGIDRRPEGFQPEREVAFPNCWLLPAIFDLSVRIDRFDRLPREREAALRGGVQTFCLQPTSTFPLDTPETVFLVQQTGGSAVLPVASLTTGYRGERLADMGLLLEAGACALAATGNLRSLALWRQALLYASTFDALVFVRAEEGSLSRGCAHEGATAFKMGLPTIPSTAETALIAALLELVAETGARIHLSCLSTARSVELVAEAKARGLPVTADVALPNLLWSEELLQGWNSGFHLHPPLRTASDRRLLLEGVASGVIDAITSDHLPLPEEGKAQPFPASLPGMATLELLLPMVARLIEKGELPPSSLSALGSHPSRILARPLSGWLIYDPKRSWRLEEEAWRSSGRNTPLWGEELSGKVVGVVTREGLIVFV